MVYLLQRKMGFNFLKTKALPIGSLLVLLFGVLAPSIAVADFAYLVVRIGDAEESSSSSSSSSSSESSYNPQDNEDPNPAYGGSPPRKETPSLIPIKKLEKGEADFNDDNEIDCKDLSLMSLFWGGSEGVFDLNEDGSIGGADLAQLLPFLNTAACPALTPLPELPEVEPTQTPQWLIKQHREIIASAQLAASSVVTKGVTEVLVVDVSINTGNNHINALEGAVSFPDGDLQVLDIKYDHSGFNIWNQTPVNDERGKIHFSGGVPGSGYRHGDVPVMRVTFKILNEGSHKIEMDAGSWIYEALTGKTLTPKSQTLTLSVPKKAPDAPEDKIAPSEPSVTSLNSPTHPSEYQWYSATSAEISWQLQGADRAYAAIDQNPLTDPAGEPQEALSLTQELEDGIWYAHVKPEGGSAETTAHLQLKIDSTPPQIHGVEYQAFLIDRSTHLIADIQAIDELSGISHFSIQENEMSAVTIDKSPYEIQTRGTKKITLGITAHDRAGNTAFINSFVKTVDKKEARRISIQLSKKERSPATTLSIIIAICGMSLLFLWSDRRTQL